MKNLKTIALLFVFGSLALLSASCSGGGGNSDPNAGFKVLTYAYPLGGNGTIVPTAGNVQGQFLSGSGTYGSLQNFSLNTSGGVLQVRSAKVPGTWRLALGPGTVPGSLCLTYEVTDRNVSLNSEETINCPGRSFGFIASPDLVDALNPPATITFAGKAADNAYGSPVLAFYDEFGNVAASTQSSQMLWDNGEPSGLVVSVPNLSLAHDGTYTVVVHNVLADGSWEVVGAAGITIYGNPPPPPPPPPGGEGCNSQPRDQPQLPCDPQY